MCVCTTEVLNFRRTFVATCNLQPPTAVLTLSLRLCLCVSLSHKGCLSGLLWPPQSLINRPLVLPYCAPQNEWSSLVWHFETNKVGQITCCLPGLTKTNQRQQPHRKDENNIVSPNPPIAQHGMGNNHGRRPCRSVLCYSPAVVRNHGPLSPAPLSTFPGVFILVSGPDCDLVREHAFVLRGPQHITG